MLQGLGVMRRRVFPIGVVLSGLAIFTISAAADELRFIRRLTQASGWVVAGNHLLSTASSGSDWADHTPPAAQGHSIFGAFFLDGTYGWVLSGEPGATSLELSRTTDGGATWSMSSLALSSQEAGNFGTTASLDFVDPSHGWAMLRQASSSNFSLGMLFATQDAGVTWERLADPPIGDPVRFASKTDGWLAGGAAGDQLYGTHDAGNTWFRQSVVQPDSVARGAQAKFQLPAFTAPLRGALAVSYQGVKTATTAVFVTSDGGRTWKLDRVLARRSREQSSALATFDAHVIPLRTSSDIPSGAAIIQSDFVDAAHGWIVANSGRCTGFKTGCFQERRLLDTSDGGRSYRDITPATAAVPDATSLGSGLGYDACSITSTGNMQTWYKDSPFRYANVYIGGSNRACSQPGLGSGWVKAVTGQGWKLIPTWVGPQAPCSSCTGCSKFSSNPSTASAQASSEAAKASSAAAALGLTSTIVYYDMEQYNSNSSCSAAVQAFVNTWVAGMNNHGNDAGVYGSAQNANDDWSHLAHVPDDVWIAYWNGVESVYNIPGLSNSYWTNHRRIHQYRGGHTDTFGGVSQSVDSDYLDGRVTP